MFSFLKNAALNLERVSLLSGYVGIQIKSSFFSNKVLSFDFVSRIPALIIILVLNSLLSLMRFFFKSSTSKLNSFLKR